MKFGRQNVPPAVTFSPRNRVKNNNDSVFDQNSAELIHSRIAYLRYIVEVLSHLLNSPTMPILKLVR